MISISLNEAKTHFSSLVSSVEHKGDKYIILKHGVPVAEIIPVSFQSRIALHKEIKNIEIKYDPAEPTEKEWAHV
jgi:prevent-host-death family protein